MRIPNVLSSLVDQGVVERVVRPLMSGKEAQIYLVESGGMERVAKIYKEADNRTFKHRADYTEGRKVRNSRDQRAINKRSQHGRDQDEAAWRSTEVDMIYRLSQAGVRVPAPYHFIDGVLIMELVIDAHGEPAPRLGEVDFAPAEAQTIYRALVQDVVRMLCAGVVHGDLSDFNVLLGANGPVIIDFPQAVDPSMNQNARKLLLRDVENLHRFYTRFVPNGPRAPYAEEMWALYESNRLTPETRLVGQYRGSQKKANVADLMDFIGEVNEDERRRRRALGRDTSAIPAAPNRAERSPAQRPARGAKPGARPPEQRPPEQRPPEQRPPEQRPPEQRPPEQRPPEQRPPARAATRAVPAATRAAPPAARAEANARAVPAATRAAPPAARAEANARAVPAARAEANARAVPAARAEPPRAGAQPTSPAGAQAPSRRRRRRRRKPAGQGQTDGARSTSHRPS